MLVATIYAGRGGYARWQERRLVERADKALQQNDYRTASLAARSALNLKPNSVTASRIMAKIGEHTGDRGALDWRRKVVLTLPQSADDILEWARCAVLFNDIAMAEKALAQMPQSVRDSAGYHAVTALVAQARHQIDLAEKEWREAVRLAPTEHAYQLQYSILQIRSPDPTKQSAAEKTLRDLRNDPHVRVPAARALITEGVARHRPNGELVDLSRELQGYPEANLSDKILYLDFMYQVQDPKFAGYLTQLEKASADNPVSLTQLLSWMSIKNLNLVAADFVKTLPREIVTKWPVPLAMADIYFHLRDWSQLLSLTKDQTWQQDFLRRAFLANVLRAQDKPAQAEREWAAAVKDASNDSNNLISLVSLVSQWRWEAETVDLLWALTKRPEKQNEAIGTLYRYYARNSDTRGLHRVLLRLAELNPSNLDVKNNLAQTSLLLNAQPEEARRMAADIYQKEPSNAAYATTYAYGLLTKGQIAQAAKIMNSLSEQQLRDPAVSAYYGICLAAAKDPRAHEFLEIGNSAPLLPEEKALIEKALGHIQP
jgi:tetratricopeptide (TPR) repeat protein